MSTITQLIKSAEDGNAESQYQLGCCAEYGDGAQKELATANFWYTKAAEQGHKQAKQKLDQFKQLFEGYFAKRDSGDHQVQFMLGYCYGNGIGVEMSNENALHWYFLSADQNNAGAQNKIGDYYYHGWGVQKDEHQAFLWFTKSAQNGSPIGQCNLGWCYAFGCGVEQDHAKAIYWFNKSAEQGDHAAERLLGWCYSNGVGVEQDYGKAEYWLSKGNKTPNVNTIYVIG